MTAFAADEPLPSLYCNGAEDPDRWQPARSSVRECVRPECGDLVGWRYAAWLVHEIRPYADVDLTDDDRARLDRIVSTASEDRRPSVYARNRPFHIVLRHHNGPLIIKPGEGRGFTRLHDGTREVSFTSWPRHHVWQVLRQPYHTCSCHGHIWPCQEYDQAVVAAHQARKMDRAMATTQPGVCAHCLEPISSRQKALTFPEESLFVPGAPGPTFHAGRAECWRAAERYEREGRLKTDPDVIRLASCPGVRFIHEGRSVPADRRVECTAGPFCTGHHGPSGYRQEAPCWHRVQVADGEGAYPRPARDCGYRGGYGACLGGDLSAGGTTLSPVAADLMWEHKSRRGGVL